MSHFPLLRMRRRRSHDFIRRLTQENSLRADDLIWPIFVHEEKSNQTIASLPDVERLSLEGLWQCGEKACELNIPMIAIFPVIPKDKKDDIASEAENENGLVYKAIAGIKKRFPELGVMTDVALDPYTSHGHDGILATDGTILNDETVDILCRQALLQANIGSDVVAPSDMMDGRILSIRETLEKNNHKNTKILAYSAKYASAFYGPFRDAVGSGTQLGGKDKKTYQMNPANTKEALQEIEMDINEGADMIMVKPGMPYLDIIRLAANKFYVPIFAYQVSGEYAMLKAAANNGWLDANATILESLLAFKRAGASGILSYFSPVVAEMLRH